MGLVLLDKKSLSKQASKQPTEIQLSLWSSVEKNSPLPMETPLLETPLPPIFEEANSTSDYADDAQTLEEPTQGLKDELVQLQNSVYFFQREKEDLLLKNYFLSKHNQELERHNQELEGELASIKKQMDLIRRERDFLKQEYDKWEQIRKKAKEENPYLGNAQMRQTFVIGPDGTVNLKK